METTIVKIGNSQGIIIPKKILSSLGESKKFDLQLRDGGLFVQPWVENKIRYNWEQQFVDAIQKGYLPESDNSIVQNEFNKEEWTW